MHLRSNYILLFLLGSIFLVGQDIPSLQNKLKTASGNEKGETCLAIAKIYSEKYGLADSMLFYSQEAFKVSQDQELIRRAKISVARAYSKKNLYDTSSVILNKLLSEVKDSKTDCLGDIHLSEGLNQYWLSNNKAALENYLKAASSFKDADGLALTYCRLAALFSNERQTVEAKSNAKQATTYISSVKDPFTKISVLSGLAGVYIQLGIQDKKLLDSAIVLAKEALSLIVEQGYYSKANQLCNTLSNVYYLKRDSIAALEYCKQSLKFRKYLLPNEILISYLNLSDCYNRVKQHANSLIYLDSVALILPAINDPFYQMGLYERIYSYNKDAGNLKVAIAGLERFKTLQDSLYTLDKNSAINDLMQKYNKSENEKKINELNKENEIASLNVKILAVGILAAVLIILVIIFFYRQSVLKSKFKALETEQRLNRARMNPHFFFNALASIQTLSMDLANQPKVSGLISKFSKIMRQSLESTYDELATIEDEISFLTSYLDIQKTRFDNKFDYEIKVDEKLEQDELKILSMLLQPFLENSIEHGFKNIDYKGKLEINFEKEEDGIKVEVKDNGKGFDPNKEHKAYPSRATQIIADRLFILNKQHRSKADFKIISNSGEPGVSVIIHLPSIY